MIKVADKDKDYVYIYSNDNLEIYHLMSQFQVKCTTVYNNCPAIIVKKEKQITEDV